MENQLKKLKFATFSQLAKKDLFKVRKFIASCKEEDGYEPIFYWGIIEKRKNTCINDLIYYNEAGEIISYLALYHFEENEIEMTLMIAPHYRDLVFYRTLLAQIRTITTRYPINISRYIFSCNQEDLTLKTYLRNLNAYCFQLTHKLILTSRSFACLEKNNVAIDIFSLELRKAKHTDIFSLIQLEVDCFQVCRELYKEQVCQMLQDPTKEVVVAIKDQKIIGKIHIHFEKGKAYLYDFCITPDIQQQGYGTSFLFKVLKNLFSYEVKKIVVDVKDSNHIKWYKKFNFKLLAIYEHWRLSAYNSPIKERERQLEALLLNFHCHQVQDQLSHPVYKH